jgi:hypothetical protein
VSICGILFEKSESGRGGARASEEERARRLEASYLRSLRVKGTMRRKDLQDRLPQVNCPVRAGNTWLTEGLCG